MALGIVLRTVCGCERVLMIPFRSYPPTFAVPYVRTHDFWMTAADGDTAMDLSPVLGQKRTFERTHKTGTYGYPVYLEVL